MKLALILAMLTLAAPLARAETFAFVDIGRVYQESTEAQRIAADVSADKQTKDNETNSAIAAWEKARDGGNAKPAEVQTLYGNAAKLAKMNADDHAKHAKEAWAPFHKRLSDVTAKLQSDRHVTVLGAVPLVEDTKRDLTDELIRRLNDSDVVALAAKVAKFEAEKKVAPAAPPAPVAKN